MIGARLGSEPLTRYTQIAALEKVNKRLPKMIGPRTNNRYIDGSAIRAAMAAFPEWPRTTPAQRPPYFMRWPASLMRTPRTDADYINTRQDILVYKQGLLVFLDTLIAYDQRMFRYANVSDLLMESAGVSSTNSSHRAAPISITNCHV